MSTAKTREHPTKIECIDCAKMPTRPPEVDASWEVYAGVEFRPLAPRKIDPRSTESHKASPRCTTHWRAWRNGQRAKGAAARSRKRSGLDEEIRQAVKAFQEGRCPCGAPLLPIHGRRIEPDADHCHDLAAGHDHPEEVACPECFRGFLCRGCNRDVIGVLSRGGRRSTAEVITSLRNLADYLEDPPMRRMMRGGPRSTIGETA